METSVYYEELDVDITEKEISECIKRLNSSIYIYVYILNELLAKCHDIIALLLTKLFNVVFNTGLFAERWSTGNIVPVYKKGNPNDTSNNRGITLISCLGKLFTFVLNARLTDWDDKNDILYN